MRFHLGRSTLAVCMAVSLALLGCSKDNSRVGPCSVAALVFAAQPGNTTGGATLPPVRVEAHEASGEVASCYTGNVTVSLGSNPGGVTLSGTTTVAAVAGVATFANLRIDKAATGYTLIANGAGASAVTSTAFSVAPGAATQLAITAQPNSTVVAMGFTPAVVVAAMDPGGNTDPSFHGAVTLALGTDPGNATLSGTTTVTAVAGIATFAGVSVDKAGTGYTLTASASGLSTATSAAFTVLAQPVAQLGFSVQPTTTVAGIGITPAVTVIATDSAGHTDTHFSGAVTVSIATNPSQGTLAGTTTVSAVAGIAMFAGLSIDKLGTGYALSASAAGAIPATSVTFDVVVGAASKLVFGVQPSTTFSGGAITPTVTVLATDAAGNTAPGYVGAVTVAIGTNPSSGTLSGVATVNAVAGVATFTGLSIDKAGTGYTLTASASGLSGATSAAFDVTAAGGSATKLAFSVQPSSTVAGASITPAVTVAATDAGGTTDSHYTGAVTIAIGTNPAGGTLSGTATGNAVAGVARFTGLSIDKPGTGYTLSASASGLTSATSASFAITPPSSTLPSFGHVVIVVEENTSFSEVTATSMPYLFALASQYGVATQDYANTHPSIGNYFEMTAGQIITNDDSYQLTVTADNIVRQLLAAGKTWKDYAEDLPSVGYTGPTTGNYARKHNPLSFFSDVVNDSVQVKRLVPFTQFALDLAGDTLPNYSFVVPNLCNDAHDCDLLTADNWLQANIAPLLNNPSFKQDGMLIITFDEASGDDTNGGGRIFWTVISPKAKTGYTSTTLYQHQSTLRLMAEALGLTSFPGDAASAPNMAEFFHP